MKIKVFSQDTTVYKLLLDIPLMDLPQNNIKGNYNISMNQSLELSKDLYDVANLGVDYLGDKIFKPQRKTHSNLRRAANFIFKYGVNLGFSKFGSELPIPLGVWGHEEYHRSVLSVNGVRSKNGNWLLNGWNGTVYGIEDSTLFNLKSMNLESLLYSYVSGIQYEIMLNQKITMEDFYNNRSLYKNALLLYNVYYVYDYFKFSTSSQSDTVKILAPKFESKRPSERDFAGADLTAWAYDMFNPNLPYSYRDSFPNGEGLNRRIGFSDLSNESQKYLVKQKQLSLLNFINPAILFVNKIRLTRDFSFNVFTQYAPTNFGNSISVYLPIKFRNMNLLFNGVNYSNRYNSYFGFGLGIFDFKISKRWNSEIALDVWNQPESFLSNSNYVGGQLRIKLAYEFAKRWSAYINVTGKSKGWVIGTPYLNNKFMGQLGVNYSIRKEANSNN